PGYAPRAPHISGTRAPTHLRHPRAPARARPGPLTAARHVRRLAELSAAPVAASPEPHLTPSLRQLWTCGPRNRGRRGEVGPMLSAKSLFQEILDHDESFALFCSIAASGESQGG